MAVTKQQVRELIREYGKQCEALGANKSYARAWEKAGALGKIIVALDALFDDHAKTEKALEQAIEAYEIELTSVHGETCLGPQKPYQNYAIADDYPELFAYLREREAAEIRAEQEAVAARDRDENPPAPHFDTGPCGRNVCVKHGCELDEFGQCVDCMDGR